MRYNRAALLFVLAGIVGCHESPTSPAGAIVGTWGGSGAELTAKHSNVSVRLSCNFLLANEALIPDRRGRFVLSTEYPRPRFGESVVIRGSVAESRIDLEVITVTTDTTVVRNFVLIRDEPGTDWGYCAL